MSALPEVIQNVERDLIGAALVQPDRLHDLTEYVGTEDFADRAHGMVWRVLIDLERERAPVNLHTVTERLMSNGTLGAVGGKERLIELGMSVTSAAHGAYHARLVARAAQLRRLQEFASRVAAGAGEVSLTDEGDVSAYVAEAQEKLWALSQDRAARLSVETVGTSAPAALAEVFAPTQAADMQTGLADLDLTLIGLRRTEVCVIAARPGVGKTTIGAQIALNVARTGLTVLFASLEMPRTAIVERLLSNVSGVSGRHMRARRINAYERSELEAASRDVSRLKLHIAETLDPSPAAVRSACRRVGKPDLVVVDYLQFMREKGHDTRWAEVSSCSAQMKRLAKEFGCSVIALAQLARSADSEKPRLSHLRESGSIEQDADQVLLLSPEDGSLFVQIAKNRSGPIGETRLAHRPDTFFVGNAVRIGEALDTTTGTRYERNDDPF